MRIEPLEPYLSSLDGSARARVESSLHRTNVGNGLEDYVTPLIPDGDPDYWRAEIRDMLLGRLTLAKYPWLREAEIGQAEKIGSYSKMLPYDERMPNVHSYFCVNGAQPDVALLNQAIRKVGTLMPRDLDPLPLSDSISIMPKGTNLGAPYFTSDKRFIAAVYDDALRLEQDGFVFDNLPALMFFRGQPRGIGLVSKNRTVWGISHITIAHGLRLQRPLLNILKLKDEFVAWNALSAVDNVITSFFFRERRQIISVDFSSYDQTLHPSLIEGSWELIRMAFKSKHSKLITWLRDQMINVPLLTPEGILVGKHAMPSGDALTNLIDGLSQLILWNYMALLLGRELLFSTVQGDDGVLSFNIPIEVEVLRELIQAHFGMKLSSDKGMVDPDTVTFLQNVHNRNFRVDGASVHVRPIMRALNGMLSYERLVRKSAGWNGFMDTIRWWQQSENCKYHPSFEILVKYLYDNDKYSRLPANTVIKASGGIEKVASALKQPSFPYGKEPLSKLNDYKTVRMLAWLRGDTGKTAHQV